MPRLRNRLVSFGLAVAVLALSAGLASAQAPMKWNLKKGETLKYGFAQSNDIKITFNGQQQSNKSELTIDLTWKVDSVAADGSAEMTQVVDRARAKIVANGTTINYDSSAKENADPGAMALAKVYEAVVGKPFTFKLNASGQISDVKVPEAVTAALVGSPFQAMADSGSFLSAKGVENMMAQVLPKLDPKATNKGAKWDTTLKLPTDPLTMNLKTAYTLTDPGPPATIDADIQTDITAAAGAPVSVTINKQTGKAAFTFDSAAGRLRSSSINQSFDMTIKANETEIAQTITISSNLTAAK